MRSTVCASSGLKFSVNRVPVATLKETEFESLFWFSVQFPFIITTKEFELHSFHFLRYFSIFKCDSNAKLSSK